MGGHAFKDLHCPRIPPNIYAKVKTIATSALQTVFTHVIVPFEVPDKIDHGDIDFLVSAPFAHCTDFTLTTFPFQPTIEAIKHALDTPHGRRGLSTPDCMYFAIPLPSTSAVRRVDEESDDEGQVSWVQVDVKICFVPEMFSWMTFELNYVSQSSILGGMIKPLGLTLDPIGLHVRVEDMEDTDWPGSMVLVTKDPWMACRVLGLGRRAVDGGFQNSEQIYEEYAGSWLFHPETFRAKLEDESYLVQHSHRAHFLKKWIPERYPDYKLKPEQHEDIVVWTARTRQAVRKEVFTRFPCVAAEYYIKRSKHVNETEERKLRELITSALPTGLDGWNDDFDIPSIVTRQPLPQTVFAADEMHPAMSQGGELTPPPSPLSRPTDPMCISSEQKILYFDPTTTPVYIDALPRQPPHSCKLSPPPQRMSAAARLACLARWTAFSGTGSPYLLSSPHAKDFDLKWIDAIEAGASGEALTKWAEEMWWIVWVRQCVVNWRGMWAKRFEKEDAKAEKGKEREEEARVRADELARRQRAKALGRLAKLNRVLGLAHAER